MKSRQFGWILAALLLFSLVPGSLFGQSGENAGIPTNIDYPNNPIVKPMPEARTTILQRVSRACSTSPAKCPCSPVV